jgi:peptidoglycan/LPS O-acetylase OafA/YrhL
MVTRPHEGSSPVVAPSSGQRLAGIEGLRAIAASAIVIVHVWGFGAADGWVLGSGRWTADAIASLSAGVTLFFTLSGFLLYRPFAAAIARDVPYPPIRSYLRNRVLRIAPAYWAILAVTGLLLGATYVRDAAGKLQVGRLSDPVDLLQTALLLQDYRPDTMILGIGPAWSLAVEAVFYCVLPVLVLAAAWACRFARDRRGRIAVLLGPPLLLLALGLAGKFVEAHFLPGDPTAGYSPDWRSVLERSFIVQADLFSFGMTAAVVHVQVVDGHFVFSALWRRLAVALGTLVFVASAWTMHQAEHSFLVQNTGEAFGLALLLAAIVLPAPAGARPFAVVRPLERRTLVAIGVVSYSLFLWHLPVLLWLKLHGFTAGGGVPGLVFNLVLIAVVAGALSALSYRYVELPALRRKRSTRERREIPAREDSAASARTGDDLRLLGGEVPPVSAA